MQQLSTIYDYMRAHAVELGERILSTYPALHRVEDPPSPLLGTLLRQPFAAQTLAIMGLVKRWELARSAKVIAECGTGKTLISLGAMHVHLLRNVLAAYALNLQFCVLLDARRPDLIEQWYRIMRCVSSADLRTRCKVLTWQELACCLPAPLQHFLAVKYGISSMTS